MKKISIRFSTRLITGFSVITVSIVALVAVALYSIDHIAQSKKQLDESFDITRELTQLRADANRLNSLFLEATLSETAAERQAIASIVAERVQRVDLSIQRIREGLANDPALLGAFAEIEPILMNSRANRVRQLELLEQDQQDAVFRNFREVQTPFYLDMRTKILELEQAMDNKTKELFAASESVVRGSFFTLLLVGLLIISLTLLIAFATIRLVMRISKEIRESVSVLSTTTAEIQTTIAEISTGAAETATAISETTTTVEEIRQTSMMANEKAKNLMHSSQKAADISEKGLESSQQMIDSMGRIDTQMKIINDTIIKLSDQNRSIGEITSTVADIADQSNLLAVNAAIEAAKAGDHGRGFSVVAQEIRSLSEQSKKSTIQVKDILNEIQKSVNQAVDVINQGAKTVEEGSRLVADDRIVVEMLTDNVDEAMQASIQISSSSQQQMAGMDQIVPAMENIKQASEQNVAGIRQTQEAARDLHELGQTLKKLIEKFRL